MPKLADYRTTWLVTLSMCLFSAWLVHHRLQAHSDWTLQAKTLQQIQVHCAHSADLANDQQVELATLVSSLQKTHPQLVRLLGVLQFGDPVSGQQPLTQWPMKHEALAEAAQSVFSALNAMSETEHEMARVSARHAAMQRELSAIGNSLTQFFASSLSADLTLAQLRLFHLIYVDIQQWRSAIAAVHNDTAPDSDADLPTSERLQQSIDALLIGDLQIANLALRRHIANLRLRVQDQRAKFTLLQEEHERAQQSADRRQALLTSLTDLRKQADALFETAHTDQSNKVRRVLLMVLGMLILLSVLTVWWVSTRYQPLSLNRDTGLGA